MKSESASLPPILLGLLQKECDAWTAAHPVGSVVRYGDTEVTIASPAFVTKGALPVAYIVGSTHYIALSKLSRRVPG
jgi:hypothetical protein